MKTSTLEGAAFCLTLGLGACTDGLADTPGGMAALMGGVALSGLLVHLAHTRTLEVEREGTEAPRSPRNAQRVPLHGLRWRPTEGKKKAATVVATPRRQVKQSGKANISRPYFTGAEGECQMEKAITTNGKELLAIQEQGTKRSLTQGEQRFNGFILNQINGAYEAGQRGEDCWTEWPNVLEASGVDLSKPHIKRFFNALFTFCRMAYAAGQGNRGIRI